MSIIRSPEPDDAAALRDAGFSDDEIVDITIAAAARNFSSRSLHARGVAVDVPPSLSPELAEALLSAADRGDGT